MTVNPNDIVAGYHFVQRLGQGSTGTVWLAREVDTASHVAIKLLRVELLSQASAQLAYQNLVNAVTQDSHRAHPNLVQARTTIHQPLHGLYGIVSEHTDGRTLDAISIPRSPSGLPGATDPRILASVLSWFQQLASVLVWLHGQGVVHGQVKPRNVVLVSGHERPVLKLLDLCWSRAGIVGPRDAASTAPEILAGEPPTPATDQWALARLLRQLIAGPGGGEDDEALAAVPGPLLDLLRRALARDPRDRFPSTPLFASALEAVWAELAAAEAEALRTLPGRTFELRTPPGGSVVSGITPPRTPILSRPPIPGIEDAPTLLDAPELQQFRGAEIRSALPGRPQPVVIEPPAGGGWTAGTGAALSAATTSGGEAERSARAIVFREAPAREPGIAELFVTHPGASLINPPSGVILLRNRLDPDRIELERQVNAAAEGEAARRSQRWLWGAGVAFFVAAGLVALGALLAFNGPSSAPPTVLVSEPQPAPEPALAQAQATYHAVEPTTAFPAPRPTGRPLKRGRARGRAGDLAATDGAVLGGALDQRGVPAGPQVVDHEAPVAEAGREADALAQACSGGKLASCERASRMLLGLRTPVAEQRARKALERACDGQIATACKELSRLYAEGIGGRADERSAHSFRDRACRLGLAASCGP